MKIKNSLGWGLMKPFVLGVLVCAPASLRAYDFPMDPDIVKRMDALKKEYTGDDQKKKLVGREIVGSHSDDLEIYIGDCVIDADGWIGTVTKLFRDGRAEVQFIFSSKIHQVSTLSKAVTSLGDFRVRDTVIDANGSIGTITKLFRDGRAEVQFIFSSKIYQVSSLVKSAN